MNIVNLADKNLAESQEYEQIILDGKSWTNREMHSAHCRLSQALSTLGLTEGDAVAVVLPVTPEAYLSFSAIWRFGGVVVPLHLGLNPIEIDNILRAVGAKMIITTAQVEATLRVEGNCRRVVVGLSTHQQLLYSFDQLIQESPPLKLPVQLLEDAPACIIFTSGSTGAPSGVVQSHKNLISKAVNIKKSVEKDGINCVFNGQTKRVLHRTSLAHTTGPFTAVAMYLNECTTVISDDNPEKTLKLIEDYKIQSMNSAPAFYISLLHHPSRERFNTSSMETWISAGASITEKNIREFESVFPGRIIQIWGLSEEVACGTIERSRAGRKLNSCGQPVDGVEIQIRDQTDKALPIGETGEICIRSDSVAIGYFNSPAKTQETFKDGWLLTGDIGYLDKEGYLYLVDRKKNLIIQGGVNIVPNEIEQTLSALNGVRECAVVGLPDDYLGEVVSAYVVLAANSTLTRNDVLAHCQTSLAEYKVPKHISFIDQLPLTKTGKVDKPKLRQHSSTSTSESVNFRREYEKLSVDQKTALVQAKISALLSTIRPKQKAPISLNAAFVDQGITSLMLIQLIINLRELFDRDLPTPLVFEYPTVKELTEQVVSHVDASPPSSASVRILSGFENLITKPFNPSVLNQHQLSAYRSRFENLAVPNSGGLDYKNVLLTGVTGYVGIYLFAELLRRTLATVHVVIRAKTRAIGKERLEEQVRFHFGDSLGKSWQNRVIVHCGDLALEDINLPQEIDCIIHSAAKVSHFGNEEEYNRINVVATKRLVDFAMRNGINSFHHMSTPSVMGRTKEKEKNIFTEFDLEIGQSFENLYARTKFDSEVLIEEARNQGFKMNVYRIGHVVFNAQTGHFQKNINQNGFYGMVRTFSELDSFPTGQKKIFDFSYADAVSKAILTIFDKVHLQGLTFHILNTKFLSCDELGGLLLKSGVISKQMPISEIYRGIESKVQSERLLFELFRILNFKSIDDRIFISDWTDAVLNSLGFNWDAVTIDHITKMVAHCVKVGFLEHREKTKAA